MLYRAVSGSRLKKGMAGNPTVLPHHTSPCSLIHDDDDEDDGCDDGDDDNNVDHDGEDNDYGWKSAFMMMMMVVVIMKAWMMMKRRMQIILTVIWVTSCNLQQCSRLEAQFLLLLNASMHL